MNRCDWRLVICLLMLGAMLGCGGGDKGQPTPSPIPGWERLEGGGIELWLPESYEGGDPTSEDLEMIVEGLEALGPEFEQMVDLIEQNPAAFALWAFDPEVGDSGFLTNVNIAKEKVPSAVTIDAYLDVVVKQLPPQFRVVDQEIVSLERFRAGRLILEFTISGVQGKELLYAVKDGNMMWSITYATGAGEFDARLAVFEQSMRTFGIQP